MESFGKTISAARKRLGLTQQEVARQMKVSITYVSDIENDRRAPEVREQLESLAEVLRFSLPVLLAHHPKLGWVVRVAVGLD